MEERSPSEPTGHDREEHCDDSGNELSRLNAPYGLDQSSRIGSRHEKSDEGDSDEEPSQRLQAGVFLLTVGQAACHPLSDRRSRSASLLDSPALLPCSIAPLVALPQVMVGQHARKSRRREGARRAASTASDVERKVSEETDAAMGGKSTRVEAFR
jgi:hypothetical protein